MIISSATTQASRHQASNDIGLDAETNTNEQSDASANETLESQSDLNHATMSYSQLPSALNLGSFKQSAIDSGNEADRENPFSNITHNGDSVIESAARDDRLQPSSIEQGSSEMNTEQLLVTTDGITYMPDPNQSVKVKANDTIGHLQRFAKGAETISVAGWGDRNEVHGTNGREEIKFIGDLNELDGKGGNDLIFAEGNWNRLKGGAGNDILAAKGNNILLGGDGNDLLILNDGHRSGMPSNTIFSDPILNGGSGNDTLVSVRSSNVTLYGGDTGIANQDLEPRFTDTYYISDSHKATVIGSDSKDIVYLDDNSEGFEFRGGRGQDELNVRQSFDKHNYSVRPSDSIEGQWHISASALVHDEFMVEDVERINFANGITMVLVDGEWNFE